ncbi:MAG TPA: acylphosphatase [Candidatus Baltobacteraceae bacterium]|nr:acylphosphatase [Candidatus Baltobacteraceae bacterium]
MIRVVTTIAGRVQGVGFRASVLDVAARHRVAGTVRNLRDGRRIEVDAEGERADVERFIDDVLAHPPRFARIDRVERTEAQPRGASGFTDAPTA